MPADRMFRIVVEIASKIDRKMTAFARDIAKTSDRYVTAQERARIIQDKVARKEWQRAKAHGILVKSAEAFRAEYLSVLFAGWQLSRIHETHINQLREMTGVTQMQSLFWQQAMLPSVMAVDMRIAQMQMHLLESHQTTTQIIGGMVYLLRVVGGIAQYTSQVVLAYDGLMKIHPKLAKWWLRLFFPVVGLVDAIKKAKRELSVFEKEDVMRVLRRVGKIRRETEKRTRRRVRRRRGGGEAAGFAITPYIGAFIPFGFGFGLGELFGTVMSRLLGGISLAALVRSALSASRAAMSASRAAVGIFRLIPAGGVVAIIVGLVLVTLYLLKDKLISIFSGIISKAVDIGVKIKTEVEDKASDAIEAAKGKVDEFKNKWQQFKEFMSNVWNDLSTVVRNKISEIWHTLTSADAWTNVLSSLGGWLSKVKSKFNEYLEPIKDKIKSLMRKLRELTGKKVEAAPSPAKDVGEGVTVRPGTPPFGGTSKQWFDYYSQLTKKALGVGDLIISKAGVFRTHPQDTIIATKNPMGFGTVNITVNVNASISSEMDLDEVARVIAEKIRDEINLRVVM